MLFRILDIALDVIKRSHISKRIQQVLMGLALFVSVHILAYQYILWQHQIEPTLELYVKSYIFKEASLLFLCLAAIALIVSKPLRKESSRASGQFTIFLRTHKAALIRRSFYILFIVLVLAIGTSHLLPNPVKNIKIVFLNRPNFDKYAFVYTIYELNKRQKYWHFDIVFDDFNENSLTIRQMESLSNSPTRSLSLAQFVAEDDPLIAITTESLGEDFFFQNLGKVSVISTYRWEAFEPPSIYEFLAFSIVQQSILIHLNAHGEGLPEEAFQESNIAFGNLFQFSPKRKAVKAFLLAAHLSAKDQELLLNCFGMDYLRTCCELLALDWLRSDAVKGNLRRCFGVDVSESR